jgi:uncharacterized protein YndB with AHSA1/START domain
MKSSLLMNFSVDKENKKIKVEREFAAPIGKVWAAWTQKEYLDQWWAPKPYKGRTKSMDFRVGGTWLYCMVGPNGEEHWSKAQYRSINEEKNFAWLDAFCDSNGKINEDFPRTNWTVDLHSKGGSTIVNIVLTYKEVADLEKLLEMGFREGFLAAMENLDEIFGK